MSKGVSLDGIKKCLKQIMDWIKGELNKKVKIEQVGTIDANKIEKAGVYRANTWNNVPSGDTRFYNQWGNLIIINGGLDTLAQLYFPPKPGSCFSARWGGTANGNDSFTNMPWLYFHGSTNANIPVLKQFHIDSGETDDNGKMITYKLYPAIYKKIIVLNVFANSENNNFYYAESYYDNSGQLAGLFFKMSGDKAARKTIKNITIQYLEIPSDYDIPNTTPTSDETNLENQPTFEE